VKNLFCGSAYVRERARRANLFVRANRDGRSELGRAMVRFRRIAAMAGAFALIAPLGAFAQSNAVPARIVTQINESSLTTLRGNTHPLARAQYDQGAVADSLPMHRMLLLLQRSAQQETALRTLIDQQQSKTSPSFHQWLTPQQFGQQYGPAPADIQAVTSWLTSHGFQVARVSTGGTLIEFSGTAGQVLNAFHTQIHRYAVNGEEHFANSTDPQIPTALASVVAGPVSLHNFPKKAQSHSLGVFRKNTVSGQAVPLFSFSNACASNSATGTTCNALGPGDFATIYNVQSLWTGGIDGTGQTIAIVGDSEICTKNSPDFTTTCSSNDDVATFRSIFGLPANSPNVILDGPDPGLNGDEIEGNLDVQWSGAVAKGATIDFVIAGSTEATAGTDLAAEYIVDNNLAPVMSESFSSCEAALGSTGNGFEATLWEQAAAQGISVVVSAGDSGSAGCDDSNTETAAGQNGTNFGPGVNGIASTPFNVAAGGTDFDISSGTSYQTTYWGPNATVSGINLVSAKSYIPETTWNDSCAQNFTNSLTGCTVLTSGGIIAGGGGQSNCLSQDALGNCNSYYTKPSWQTVASGSGLTGSGGANPDITRDLPDISLFAADGFISNSFYAICDANFTSGPCTATPGFVDILGVGGTSSSAPTFAGMMALVNQKMGAPQGNPNFVLYHLSANQTESACNSSSGPATTCTFNDITKGNNSVPCVGGIFACSNSSSGGLGVLEALNFSNSSPTGLPAFTAATGLDLATGLGSVNAPNLVNNWGGAVGAFTATTPTLCLSLTQTASLSCAGPITITHGTQVFVNIAVNGTVSGTPILVTENLSGNPSVTEDVSLVGTFPSGNPNCSVPGCTTGGVDRFGSSNYTVTNADIYPLTNGTFTSSTTSPANSNFTTNLTGGTYNVVAHYGGDGTFGASNSSPAISVTVNAEASKAFACVLVENPNTGPVNSEGVSLLPYSCAAGTTAPYGDIVAIRADVFGSASGQETASGNVTFLDGGAPGVPNPSGVTTTSFPLNTEGYTEDQTTFLGVGPHTFTVEYTGNANSGDGSYLAMTTASAVANFTVTAAPTTTKVTASSTTIATGAPVTITAAVDTASSTNPSGGSLGASPSGTVTFMSGTTSLGSASLSAIPAGDASGYDESTATLTISPTATETITAVYGGDANYTTSTTPTGVTVTVGTAGINATPGCSSSTITISSPGGSGTCLITVTGVNGFAGTVTLTAPVSMTPPSATDVPTCSFGAPDQNFTAPGTITLSTTSETGSATMTCATTAASRVLLRPSNRPSNRVWPLAGVAISLAGIFFLFMVPRQRRWKLVPLVVLLAVVAAAGISCNGRGLSGGSTNPGTTTGTYTFTVTATPSTGSAQTTAITVNVQ